MASIIRAEEEGRYTIYGYFPPAVEVGTPAQPYQFPVIIIRPGKEAAPKSEGEDGKESPAAAPPVPAGPATPAQEAERTADLILREAKKQADKILSQAWREAELIQARARESAFAIGHDEGFKAGHEEGFNKIKKDSEPIFQALQGAVQRMVKLESEIRVLVEQQFWRLALKIAQKILKREIDIASPVVENLREAVKRAVDLNRLDIRVHPEDLELVQRYRPTLLAEVEGIKAMHIQADAALAPGGCIVETNFGDIDARIERQLAELEKDIQDVTHPPAA
ncbi:MAG: hypothetical protein HYT87_03455 [Nitrospirae bacterium]|nr:hypothetical protein [Nitrospirota bacterium]